MTQHTATATGDTSHGPVHLHAVADTPQEAEGLTATLTGEEFADTIDRMNAMPTDAVIALLEQVMETTAVEGFSISLRDDDTGGSRLFRTERIPRRKAGRDGRTYLVVCEHSPA